ncbi:MAG: hypothetical protein IJ695_03330 [Butyrivibrio sp.]|nr:hypothetical protein [Butyrivibrio sp.]
MAYIEEISPANLDAFDELIPKVFKEQSLNERGYRFYGISESDEAVGCVIFVERADTVEILYIYVLPYLRGTGIIDQMLMLLFLQLRDTGFSKVKFNYLLSETPEIAAISRRFEFEESPLDMAYFRFEAEVIKKCVVSTYEPKGIVRVRYLPPEKKDKLFKLIEKNLQFYDFDFNDREDILPYSMAYLEGEQPRGALIVQTPKTAVMPLADDIKRYPEPGAMDLTLFFVGTSTMKAPLYLLSGLCRTIQKEIDDSTILTGYFPEGHVTRLIEGALGVKGYHEVCATLELDTL